jgi:hypothetical protein
MNIYTAEQFASIWLWKLPEGSIHRPSMSSEHTKMILINNMKILI